MSFQTASLMPSQSKDATFDYLSSKLMEMGGGSNMGHPISFSSLQSTMAQLQRPRSPPQEVASDLVSRLAAMTSSDTTQAKQLFQSRSVSQPIGSLQCPACQSEFPNIQALAGHQVLVHRSEVFDESNEFSKRIRTGKAPDERERHLETFHCLMRAHEANSKSRNDESFAEEVAKAFLGEKRKFPKHSRSVSQPIFMIDTPNSPTSPPRLRNFFRVSRTDVNTANRVSAGSVGPTSSPPRDLLSELQNMQQTSNKPSSNGQLYGALSQDLAAILSKHGQQKLAGLNSSQTAIVSQMQRLSTQSASPPLSGTVSRTSSLSRDSPPPEATAFAEALFGLRTNHSSGGSSHGEDVDLTLRLGL